MNHTIPMSSKCWWYKPSTMKASFLSGSYVLVIGHDAVTQNVSLGKYVELSHLLVVYQFKFPTVSTIRFFPRPKKGSSSGSPSAQNTSLARTCRKVTLWQAPKKSGRDLPATYHHARTARIPSLSDIPIYGWIKHVPNHQPENQYPLEILFNTKP